MTSLQVNAATVEVTFTEPEKYVDIRSGDVNRKHYRKNVFYNIEKQLKKLAKKLPEDNILKVDVIDIDLAGDIRLIDARSIRVVKEPLAPRLKFTYQLLDKNNKVIKAGEENIRDASFLMHQSIRYRNESFGHEKKLLARWFRDTFKQLKVKAA